MTTDQAEGFLRDFHARFPGATATAMAWAKMEDGRSSYERLVQTIPVTDQPLTVLDLACGDGYLLSWLQQRHQPNLHLIGIDMSPEELSAARQRLDDPAIELRQERAQALSLADASVDYIVCHMAFMLMNPLEAVVSEIQRVLKPGGTFCAIVGGAFRGGDAMAAFVTTAFELLQQEAITPIALGDRRTDSEAGLRSLFVDETGFVEPIIIEDLLLRFDAPAAQVKTFLLLTYFVTMFSDESLPKLVARTDEVLAEWQRPDGTVPCSVGLRLVCCQRGMI
jgi:SAM-dependent methyltransferase